MLLPKMASLYYLEDMNQDQIARRFNINRVRVSRYLKKAREMNIVEIKVHYPNRHYGEQERMLEKRFGLKECTIVPSHDNSEGIVGEMAKILSNRLTRILRDGDVLGVNWGLTLRETVSLMRMPGRLDVRVVPVVGGIGVIESGIHTNSIARKLADVIGGISYVINAPAILDSSEAKEILMKDSNTREVFELLRELTCAVFSFSDLGPHASYVKTGLIKDEEVEYLKRAGAVGDVNLDFLNRRGEHVESMLDDRIIALPVSEIRKIKNVIGIAYGKRKCEIAKAVLAGGIVNSLIIDSELADCVLSGKGRIGGGSGEREGGGKKTNEDRIS